MIRTVYRGLSRVWIAILLIALLAGTALQVLVVSTSAQQAAQGITVSPPIVDLNAEKGGRYDVRITVTNVTTEDMTLTSTINDFRAADDTGNPEILDDGEASPTYSVKQWVKPVASFTLRSKESRAVTFVVNVPRDAEAGGHYGVIRFNPESDETDQNLALTASVGVLLLTRVEGNITEQLDIKDIFVKQDGKKTGLVASGPVTIAARLENKGNVHVRPQGKLTVKNMFGGVVQTSDFGSNTKNVLPDSTRLFEQEFDKRFLFGRYTAQVEVSYGTTGGVLLGSTTFWVIPFKLIIFLIAFLLVLIFGLKKLIRRYNKHIIHRSNKSKS